jgi:dihydrolipoamide dehydrogenase
MAESNIYDLIIIGSGPGGYVAAAKAAQLKMKVACVEKETRLGGVCLNVGCIPSKTLLDSSEYYHLAKERFREHGILTGKVKLDLAAMMIRKEKVVDYLTKGVDGLLKRYKVDVFHGTASLADATNVQVKKPAGDKKKVQETLVLEGKAILLATGSEPIQLPGLEYDGNRIIHSTHALSLNEIPKHLCVVGGGYIGLELGSVWRRLGSEVTVIEMLPSITTTMDGQVSRTLQRILTRQGMTFKLNTKVTEAHIEKNRVVVAVQSADSEEKLSCDHLLVAVGRRPLTRDLNLETVGVVTDEKTGQILVNENYQTSVPTVYAIGDLISGPMLAHKASAEGVAAVEIMAGISGQVNYDAVPGIVYTWPETASVGLTEEQVKEKAIEYRTGVYPFTGTGRAVCMGETDGFVKIISAQKTDRILGVHIIGPRASEMIAEAVLAMEFSASAEDLARTVHGHPTLSEAVMEAAAAASR